LTLEKLDAGKTGRWKNWTLEKLDAGKTGRWKNLTLEKLDAGKTRCTAAGASLHHKPARAGDAAVGTSFSYAFSWTRMT
jgi:hypothetical protein